jgi:hypothetical protein
LVAWVMAAFADKLRRGPYAKRVSWAELERHAEALLDGSVPDQAELLERVQRAGALARPQGRHP